MITRFRFLMQLFHTWWGKVQLNYVSISLKRTTMSNRTWHLQVMGSLFHWNTMERNGISENMCIRVHMFVWNIHLSLHLSLISQTNSNSHHFSVTSGLERVLLFHVTDLTDTSCCLYKLFNHNLWHWDNCALNARYAAGTANWAVSRPSFRYSADRETLYPTPKKS